MEMESCVPPGFRFHPTEEELVGYYLARKVSSQRTEVDVISDVDLYRIEPWDLQERCKNINGHEDQKEWYFFSHKDKKYPTGSRMNRATAAGFWKATGRDKAVISMSRVIGMRKTLVFYQGRAPNGRKSDWIMHEYRLQTSEHAPPQEEGWVVCRAFKKPTPSQTHHHFPPWNQHFYPRDHDNHLGSLLSPDLEASPPYFGIQAYPPLDGSSIPPSFGTNECLDPCLAGGRSDHHVIKGVYPAGGLVDWKALDRLLGAQLNDSISSSNSSMPLMNMEYEADAQNSTGNPFIDPFPNL